MPSISRSLLLATGLAVVALAPTARADDSSLATEDGTLRAVLPGTWRAQGSGPDLVAAGFLGVKRAEFTARTFADAADAPTAAAKWKAWRTEMGGGPEFADVEGPEVRFTAHSAKQGTVDYVRVLLGKGAVAVAWLRVSGAPGVVAEEAWAALATVKSGKEKASAAGAEDSGGDSAEVPPGLELEDAELRIAVTFPPGFVKRPKVTPDALRVISVKGKVGSDEYAFADVYLFDSFRRTDAVAAWWRERERRGWLEPVRFAGDALAFTVEVQDETWTRHVRIVDTPAGIVGLKLDVSSQAGKAATSFLDALIKQISVKKKRRDPPSPPVDFTVEPGEGVTVHTETPGADAVRLEAEEVERQVGEITGLAPRDGRPAIVVVYADRLKLGVAQRLAGLDEYASAGFDPRAGVVRTYPKPLGDPVERQALREELARDALHRRLGYRAPWWLERGLALMIGSGAHHRGRVNKPHPDLIEEARDVAAGTVEFEAARWWTESEAKGNAGREAVAWSFLLLFSLETPPGKQWRPQFLAHLQALASSGDPVEANKVFDFSFEAKIVDQWKTWVRKL